MLVGVCLASWRFCVFFFVGSSIVLSRDQVDRIERLLQYTSASLNEIAQEVGVSRSTVQRIARGERPAVYGGEQHRAERCPDCGQLVSDDREPCQLCRARRFSGR